MNKKEKKPFFKKWWFYAIIVLILIGGIFGSDKENVTSKDDDSSIITDEQISNTASEIKDDDVLSFELVAGEQGEYGKMIKELGQMDGNNLNDRKQIYRTTLLQNCSFTTALQKCENPIMEFNYVINGYQNCNLMLTI